MLLHRPDEPKVSEDTPMPKGYGFLRKGNLFLTGQCRKLTHAANKTLYVVVRNKTPQGLRAPKWILADVHAQERATRATRKAVVDKRDSSTLEEFTARIRRLFPKIPEADLARVSRHALKKRSGRVGRSGKLDVDHKARLAVAAHIRHQHTRYDALIPGIGRWKARDAVEGVITRMLREWSAGSHGLRLSKPEHKKPGRKPRAAKGMVQTTLVLQRDTMVCHEEGGKKIRTEQRQARRKRAPQPQKKASKNTKTVKSRRTSSRLRSAEASEVIVVPDFSDEDDDEDEGPIVISSDSESEYVTDVDFVLDQDELDEFSEEEEDEIKDDTL